jgi:hypothetical protein
MKNKAILTGIISILLVFGLFLTGCPNPADDSGTGNSINPPPPKDITVHLEKPAVWPRVYAYVWDDSGKEYTDANPGTLLTQSGGFYSYKAQSAEYGYINVRFTDGGSQSTLDILGVDTDTWYKGAQVFSGSKRGSKV